MSSQQCDVAIIGAGLSGLCAAREIADAGKSVVVLEARDRVGGRSKAGTLLGETVDVGGQWIGASHRRARALCEELRLELFPQHIEGDRILHLNGKTKRYRGTVPSLPIFSLIELAVALRKIDSDAKRVDPAAPWKARDALRTDRQTVAQWSERRLRTKAARKIIEVGVRAIFSAEPYEMSHLHFLTYLASGGRLEEFAEAAGGAQQDRVIGGAFQIAERVADTLPGGSILLEAPVRRIRQTETGIAIHCEEHHVESQRAVVALAPPLVGRIEFEPPLPPRRMTLNSRMPMGSVVKALVAYSHPFWRQHGLSGDVVSTSLPFSPVMDACLPGRTEGMLVGFFEGDHGRLVSGMTAEERRAAVVRSLTDVFGDEARNPIAYVENDWLAERWSGGCYAALATPGVWTSLGDELRKPCGRVHWGGTETATEWMGYLEGAIQAGERAACEVLDLLRTELPVSR